MALEAAQEMLDAEHAAFKGAAQDLASKALCIVILLEALAAPTEEWTPATRDAWLIIASKLDDCERAMQNVGDQFVTVLSTQTTMAVMLQDDAADAAQNEAAARAVADIFARYKPGT